MIGCFYKISSQSDTKAGPGIGDIFRKIYSIHQMLRKTFTLTSCSIGGVFSINTVVNQRGLVWLCRDEG